MSVPKSNTRLPISKDTIAAIATPSGRGGVGIVRVSGPLASSIAQQLCPKPLKKRVATFTDFVLDGTVVDQGIAICFQAPHSFTGEDVLELQGHGGPVVMDQLLHAVLQCGARTARPGEFSERAFLNDKIDLSQAEAIADLIQADSAQAAKSAMQSLQGVFSRRIQAIVDQVIQLRMYVEAAIDFPEEEVDFLSDQRVSDALQHIAVAMGDVLATAQQGALLRDGITLAIVGEPNVGKSSLLNALTQRDSAIVTAVAGTTRDVLREDILLDELPLQLVDTAGLRDSSDAVEKIGIERAMDEVQKADVLLVVVDAASDVIPAALHDQLDAAHVIRVRNKIDLTNEQAGLVPSNEQACVNVSVKTASGLDALKQVIKEQVGYHGSESNPFIARRRHLDALMHAQAALAQGKKQLHEHAAGELLAEELRVVQQRLSEITGAYTPDDLLGAIFSTFCIGK